MNLSSQTSQYFAKLGILKSSTGKICLAQAIFYVGLFIPRFVDLLESWNRNLFAASKSFRKSSHTTAFEKLSEKDRVLEPAEEIYQTLPSSHSCRLTSQNIDS